MEPEVDQNTDLALSDLIAMQSQLHQNPLYQEWQSRIYAMTSDMPVAWPGCTDQQKELFVWVTMMTQKVMELPNTIYLETKAKIDLAAAKVKQREEKVRQDAENNRAATEGSGRKSGSDPQGQGSIRNRPDQRW